MPRTPPEAIMISSIKLLSQTPTYSVNCQCTYGTRSLHGRFTGAGRAGGRAGSVRITPLALRRATLLASERRGIRIECDSEVSIGYP